MTTECVLHPLVGVFDYFTNPIVTPKPTKPWLVDVDGQPWLFATEGHCLVAVKGDASLGEPVPKNYRTADKYLAPLSVCSSVHFEDLVKFAGQAPVPKWSDCEGCRGIGRQEFGEPVTCEHCGRHTRLSCDACGGNGRIQASLPLRFGRFDSHEPFNLSYLAFALSIVPARGFVSVGHISFRKAAEAVIVDGAEWRIAIMNVVNIDKAAVFTTKGEF